MSAESTVSRNYLTGCWRCREEESKEIRDLKFAEETLNKDHYGLDKSRSASSNSWPCAAGEEPKGRFCALSTSRRGKDSLGMSIARATGRKFVRMSLGGVRDEAKSAPSPHLHRRPSRPVIQMMKKAARAIRSSCWTKSIRCPRIFVRSVRRPTRGADRNRISCTWITTWTWSTT